MFNTEFLDFLQKSWGLYGVVFFAFMAFVFYLPKFIDSVTYFKSRKIQHINEALGSNHVDDHSKRLLSENITRIYLSRSLGISASNQKVQEILKIYDALEGEFDTLAIYRSLGDLPPNIYDFSIAELSNAKLDINQTLRLNRYFINFYVLVIFITLALFFYHSFLAFHSDGFFTYEYFNTGFLYGCGFLMVLTTYIMSTLSYKSIQEANNIVCRFIEKLE